jgi:hypothetical protein
VGGADGAEGMGGMSDDVLIVPGTPRVGVRSGRCMPKINQRDAGETPHKE